MRLQTACWTHAESMRKAMPLFHYLFHFRRIARWTTRNARSLRTSFGLVWVGRAYARARIAP